MGFRSEIDSRRASRGPFSRDRRNRRVGQPPLLADPTIRIPRNLRGPGNRSSSSASADRRCRSFRRPRGSCSISVPAAGGTPRGSHRTAGPWIAVEPSSGLQEVARSLHPSSAIRWSMPPPARPRADAAARAVVEPRLAQRSLDACGTPGPAPRLPDWATLLKPGGRMMLSLRALPTATGSTDGPGRSSRGRDARHRAWPVDSRRLLAQRTDLQAARCGLDRAGARIAERCDGRPASALRQSFSTTASRPPTSLDFLRVLARIADQSAALARHAGDHVRCCWDWCAWIGCGCLTRWSPPTSPRPLGIGAGPAWVSSAKPMRSLTKFHPMSCDPARRSSMGAVLD